MNSMVRFAVRMANEPARRFKALWNAFGFVLAALYVSLGALYALLDDRAVQGNTLNLIHSFYGGSLRPHGVVLLALGLVFTYGLADYRRITKWTLLAMIIYMAWTIILAIGQSLLTPITYTVFPWYGFGLAVGVVLWIFAPPLGADGRPYRGRPGRA